MSFKSKKQYKKASISYGHKSHEYPDLRRSFFRVFRDLQFSHSMSIVSRRHQQPLRLARLRAQRESRSVGQDTSLFPRLVLGCINTDFCNQILILLHFLRSTRFPFVCTFGIFVWENRFELRNFVNFWKLCENSTT